MESELNEAIAVGPLFMEATALFRDSIRAYADGDVVRARSLREAGSGDRPSKRAHGFA